MNELLQVIARQRLNNLQSLSDMYLTLANKDPKFYYLWRFSELTIAEGEALLAQEKYEAKN